MTHKLCVNKKNKIFVLLFTFDKCKARIARMDVISILSIVIIFSSVLLILIKAMSVSLALKFLQNQPNLFQSLNTPSKICGRFNLPKINAAPDLKTPWREKKRNSESHDFEPNTRSISFEDYDGLFSVDNSSPLISKLSGLELQSLSKIKQEKDCNYCSDFPGIFFNLIFFKIRF